MSRDEHDAVTRRSFQQQVGLFTGDDAVFARRPRSTLAWLEPLGPGMIVLDVACGAAHTAELAAPHVRQVVGVDTTAALLELGDERLRQSGIANVLLQKGDALDLPFVDASFDLVVCRSALHHVQRPERAVAEMARVCRPGGRVVVQDMVAPSAEVRHAFDRLHRRVDPSHVAVLLEGELAQLIRAEVGSLGYGETSEPVALPIDLMLTEAADSNTVMTALRAELDGGAATGFDPVLDDDRLVVSFISTVVHATRQLR